MIQLLGYSLFNLIMSPHHARPYSFNYLKNNKIYTSLSSGERALVLLAYDIYNGSGKISLKDLKCLDYDNRMRALSAIQNFLRVPRP